MKAYFRQCYYKSTSTYIYVENPYVMADGEYESLKDLLEKYYDNEDVVCFSTCLEQENEKLES